MLSLGMYRNRLQVTIWPVGLSLPTPGCKEKEPTKMYKVTGYHTTERARWHQ